MICLRFAVAIVDDATTIGTRLAIVEQVRGCGAWMVVFETNLNGTVVVWSFRRTASGVVTMKLYNDDDEEDGSGSASAGSSMSSSRSFDTLSGAVAAAVAPVKPLICRGAFVSLNKVDCGRSGVVDEMTMMCWFLLFIFWCNAMLGCAGNRIV